MALKFTSESEMERNLITQLVTGISQWTFRPELSSEEDLWANLKEKLEQNNTNVLREIPLTEQEFRQVQNQLRFSSFVEGAKWLAGENGIAKVKVQREDASLGTIWLSVLWREDVAGGHSSYEVVNQIVKNKDDSEDQNRRFDVTLLINGLPLIQIELKNHANSYMDAFRQVKKYLTQGKYTGIFSCLQMFVVSNGTDTRYIASASGEKLNDQFLSTWVDKSNQPVTNYLEFTEQVLSIPQAHKMVTQYTVIDSQKKVLILLRPYQIHAIEAIKEASKRQESGYVWHTTGSGKTLTSYKVARNLLQIPSIDKTIFLVDRVDLDQQTTSSFLSYAQNDIIEINETDNVNDLIKKLYSNDRAVIVTTVQKLNHLIRRFENKDDSPKCKKIRNLHLAFVVDECHRAISAGKQKELKRFFTRSLWYGFTGTPIFKENAKKQIGNLARTTEEQYGKRVHEYTVKEAIHDKAVLGFQVEYKSTISEEMLDDIVNQRKPTLDVHTMSNIEKEACLSKQDYEDEEHMLEVLNSIINKSEKKFGLGHGQGNTYTAILTTSSIFRAQKYYSLLKEITEKKSKVTIREKIKQKLPDFPKFAITYSVTENEEDSTINQEKMKESIADYNKQFGTKFSLESIKAYNADINERLARKQDKFRYRNEQLDLVIVVDRLLTGFDAPCMGALFIDRAPMNPQDIIQAFSRTNRLYRKEKKYGQIITYQLPLTFKQSVDEALKLYSNGGENYILAPSYEEAMNKFLDTSHALFKIAPTIDSFTEISTLERMKQYAKAYQEFDKAYTAIQVYSEFDSSMAAGVDFDLLEEYHGKYENVIEEIKVTEKGGDGNGRIDIDIEYELESITSDEINYQYILSLIQAYLPQRDVFYEKPSETDIKEINDYLISLKKRNEKFAEEVSDLWEDIQANPREYEDKYVDMLLEKRIEQRIDGLLEKFCKKWYVGKEQLRFVVNNYRAKNEKQNGETDLKDSANYQEYNANTEQPVSKLRFWKEVRYALIQMIQDEILPLRER